jgi:pimeloyl-ACP methyl ester carboxylesterase
MSGVDLHVEVHAGAGPPLLLVHGLLGGRAMWAANIDALRTVATPVVVELLGHGRSPAPDDAASYSPDRYVARFEALRDELGVERWSLVGQSLGATLTLRYALDHPQRIDAHVMTNSMSALALRVGDDAGVEMTARRIEEQGHALLATTKLNPARSHRLVAHVRDALAGDEHLLRPFAIAATVRHTAHGSSQRSRITDNTVATLIVAGAHERRFEEPCRDAQERMPNLDVVRLDAGHTPNAELPDQFNATVLDFLRARSSAG